MRSAVSLGACLWLLGCGVTFAADVPVEGTRVLARRHGAHTKLVFSSRDALWTVPAVTVGGPGVIRIDLSSPAHPDPRTVHVPAGLGRPGWKVGMDSQGTARRYSFRNRSAPNGYSVVHSVAWTSHSGFKLVVRDALLDLDAPQGGLSIRITDGENRHCARFDAGTIVADVPGLFSARDAAAAGLSDCSAASLGETATTPCGFAPDGFTCGGSCASDEECTHSVISATCQCTGGTGFACGDSGPVCNGHCPEGMHCGGQGPRSPFGRGCGCVPDGTTTCGDSESPTCGGVCSDPALVCRARSTAVSILPPYAGCECSLVGPCAIGGGPEGYGSCGGGADCAPGQICDVAFGSFGCFARCVGQ